MKGRVDHFKEGSRYTVQFYTVKFTFKFSLMGTVYLLEEGKKSDFLMITESHLILFLVILNSYCRKVRAKAYGSQII